MYPIDVTKVAAALGGQAVIGAAPATVVELAAAVARGLPRAVIGQLVANATPDDPKFRKRVAALVASPATLKRGARLSPAASERAERLARVTALAHQAIGDAGTAQRWLNDPHPLLGNGSPIEIAATDLGARQVERLLHNIEYDLHRI
jgi:putative toxin-antitoxin system antitoxin component (TIGR02293 family)